MCPELLPPGGYPVAVKYISYLKILYAKHMDFTALHVLNARNGQAKKTTQLKTHIIAALFTN
jgi:hypothetical protein